MTGGNFSLTGGFWSLVAAVQTASAPMLYISVSGNSAVLSWSNSVTSFALEKNTNLTDPNGWSMNNIPPPVTLDGFSYVTNTIAQGNYFYRLRRL